MLNYKKKVFNNIIFPSTLIIHAFRKNKKKDFEYTKNIKTVNY